MVYSYRMRWSSFRNGKKLLYFAFVGWRRIENATVNLITNLDVNIFFRGTQTIGSTNPVEPCQACQASTQGESSPFFVYTKATDSTFDQWVVSVRQGFAVRPRHDNSPLMNCKHDSNVMISRSIWIFSLFWTTSVLADLPPSPFLVSDDFGIQ